MFHTVRFIIEAATSGSQRPLGTAKDSPRSFMIAKSTITATVSEPVRKVSTGSALSATWNIDQLVPQTSVSPASSISTLGEARSMMATGGRSGLVFFRRLQVAAVDAPGPVGQLPHRIDRDHRPAIGA